MDPTITDTMLIHYCMGNREHETCKEMFDMLHTYFAEKLSDDEQLRMVTDHQVCGWIYSLVKIDEE